MVDRVFMTDKGDRIIHEGGRERDRGERRIGRDRQTYNVTVTVVKQSSRADSILFD